MQLKNVCESEIPSRNLLSQPRLGLQHCPKHDSILLNGYDAVEVQEEDNYEYFVLLKRLIKSIANRPMGFLSSSPPHNKDVFFFFFFFFLGLLDKLDECLS